MTRRSSVLMVGLLALGLGGCIDLAVTNPNQADTKRALATPGDVESLIAGSFRQWFVDASHSYYSAGMAMSCMANEHSSSWGNAGMKDNCSEPRIAIDNAPSYGYAYMVEGPWYNSYSALRSASDGLRSIADGLQILDANGNDNTARAEAWGQMVEGLALGTLANTYDQAFIYDEMTPLNSSGAPDPALDLQPHDQVLAAALQHLQNAIDIASSNDFTIPSAWLNSPSGDASAWGPVMSAPSSTQLAQLANGYMARIMAWDARTKAERDALDWTTIKAHAMAGPTSAFGISGDGYNAWYDEIKIYPILPGWARMDLQWLGQADASGQYQSWMGLDPQLRQPFIMETDDRRITSVSSAGDTIVGKYYDIVPSIPFRAARGTYHFSNYVGSSRPGYAEYLDQFFGFTPDIVPAEMQFLIAEADYRAGDYAGAAAIVNATRTTDGELPPAPADATTPVPGGSRCVPHLADGNCGTLWNALTWEKRMNVWETSMGDWYFDARGWGQLVQYTPVQFPVPAKEMQVNQLPVYTFGGPNDPTSAPGSPLFGNFVPSASFAAVMQPAGGSTSVESFLERVEMSSRQNRVGGMRSIQ